MARRSAPEEKFPLAPVRMTARMSSSVSAATMASYIRINIAPDSALSRLGRFIVMMSTAPSLSTRASGMVLLVTARVSG